MLSDRNRTKKEDEELGMWNVWNFLELERKLRE
jgi:hypothetical protein